MRHEIMICVKANQQVVDGDFWLMLIFRTDDQLVQLCHELNIPVPERA